MYKRKNIDKSKYSHWTKVETRWRDMDAIGHINHAIYLTYMETSRVELLKNIGFSALTKETENSAILGGLEINYLMQASHPEVLEVGSFISRVGSKSYDVDSAIYRRNSNDLLCFAIFRMIAFNYKTNQTIQIPKNIIEAYKNDK